MAKYEIRANRRGEAPRATIQAAPTVYEITKPAGSAERFLDDAAKEALAAAAASGVPLPSRFTPGAVRQAAATTIKYPDPLLAEAARLPPKALAESAARAEAYRRAMEAQNEVVRAASTALSPVGNMVVNQAGAAAHDALTRQDWGGGNNTVSRVEFENTAKREKTRRKAIADAKREAARPRIGAARGTSVPVMTRKQYRELMSGRGGQGDPDAVLGEGMNPLVLAAGATSPAAAAAITAPAALKARRDLREMGVDALSDPDAAFNLAMTGMMLYGAPARRVGDFKALKRIARKRYGITEPTAENIGALPVEDQLMLKRATRFERGAQGLGVETLVDPDVRLLPPTGETRVIRMEDLPSELREAISPAFVRGNNKPITVSRVPLEALQRKGPLTPGQTGETRYGRFRPAYNAIEVAEAPRDSVAQYEVFLHELDHAIRAPFRRRHDGGRLPDKRLGQELYGADLEPYVKGYYKQPEEVDAFVTAERNWLSPSERLASLRMHTAEYFTRPLNRARISAAKAARTASDSQRAFTTAAQQDAKGGKTRKVHAAVEGGEAPVPEEAPVQTNGPRIVINPTTFRNQKDALCVAFNEGFRVWMEANGFEPQSEPTDAQRKFFSDTAYADDEVQLRRTILARIATFDTSVKDPTDDQLSETASFLGAILESDWCKNEWERDSVSRLMNAVQSAVGAEPAEPRQKPLEPAEAEPLQRHAALGGGETDDEDKFGLQRAGESEQVDQAEEQNLAEREQQQQPEQQQPEQQQPEQQQPEQQQPEQQQPEQQQPEQQQPEQQQQTASQRIGMSSNMFGPGGRRLTAAEAAFVRRRKETRAAGEQRRLAGQERRGELLQEEVTPVVAQWSGQPEQHDLQTASQRIGMSSNMFGLGGRRLTAAEAAWHRHMS